jgi:hypothetical protein
MGTLPNGGGRKPGSLNKSTEQVRRAVAELLRLSAPRMIDWLEQTACGIREPGTVDKDTGLVTPGAWIIRPDPKGAAELVLKAAEYHIPKLARVESHITPGAEQSHEEWLRGLEGTSSPRTIEG